MTPLLMKVPYMWKKIFGKFSGNVYLCDMDMNYFKFLNEGGETIGVCKVGVGSKNEMNIINTLLDKGYKIVKIMEQEYDDYDEGDEITLSNT